MIVELENNMVQPFDPVTPIESVLEQLNNGQDLAAVAENPYSNMQLVIKASDLILKTRVYNNVCREWNRLSVPDNIFSNVQEHFTMTHMEMHQLQITAQQAGYTTNNTKMIRKEEDFQHRTAAVIENLVNATHNDCTTVASLSKSSMELTQQVANLTSQIK
eukprot:15332149-Ditylum_brightwellii.AAC.2